MTDAQKEAINSGNFPIEWIIDGLITIGEYLFNRFSNKQGTRGQRSRAERISELEKDVSELENLSARQQKLIEHALQRINDLEGLLKK